MNEIDVLKKVDEFFREAGKTVRERREAYSLSRESLSQKSGVSVSAIRAIEEGVGKPKLETVALLYSALGLDIELTVTAGE